MLGICIQRPAERVSVWQHNSSKHNDIIAGGATGGDAGRMRRFDGQGRGRAILPRAAASASLLRALFLETISIRGNAQYTPRVHPQRHPAAASKVTRNSSVQSCDRTATCRNSAGEHHVHFSGARDPSPGSSYAIADMKITGTAVPNY